MTEPAKKVVVWTQEAREQLRSIARDNAMQILLAVDEYLATGAGKVKKLQPPRDELALRVGDYRVFFYQSAPLSIRITSVKNRREAYR
jgi:mRNA-degrading endonuclease RelE of RelBE toxin-antitoxin system